MRISPVDFFQHFAIRTFRPPNSFFLTDESWGCALHVLEQIRAPWWKWLLFSLSSMLFLLAWLVAAGWILYRQGVGLWDFLDYLLLRRPPWITSAGVAFGFALLIVGQTLPSVVAMWLFRPARSLAFSGLQSLPDDRSGSLRRLLAGLALVLAVQVLWSAFVPPPAETWLVLDHLLYAVVRGGNRWALFWILLMAGVIAPLTEEIIFRGFLFRWLRQRMSFGAAALLTALLFGAGHGPLIVPTAILGFYLAYQAEQDGSLTGAILLHSLNNLGALLVLISQLTE
jgi:membrane protease YdiL (CAAX protease family)